MKYWYGFRVVELDGSNPGCKCLSESFNTYEEAKQNKEKYKARDMEHTAIFQAKSKLDAEQLLQSEPFSRI